MFRALLSVGGASDDDIRSDGASMTRFCQHLFLYRLFDIANRLCKESVPVAIHDRQPFAIKRGFVSCRAIPPVGYLLNRSYLVQ
jgi:hypothetical protein